MPPDNVITITFPRWKLAFPLQRNTRSILLLMQRSYGHIIKSKLWASMAVNSKKWVSDLRHHLWLRLAESSTQHYKGRRRQQGTWYRFIGERAVLQKGKTIVMNEGFETVLHASWLCEAKKWTLSLAMYSAYRCSMLTTLSSSSTIMYRRFFFSPSPQGLEHWQVSWR